MRELQEKSLERELERQIKYEKEANLKAKEVFLFDFTDEYQGK